MAGRVRCPHCGATNLVDAAWCGQCYERLGEQAMSLAPGSAAPEPSPIPAPIERAWTCPVCGEHSGLDVDSCPVCGTSMFDALVEKVEAAPPESALRASIVPGLGMGRAGMAGEGLIAGLLTVFAVLGGLIILIAGEPLALLVIGAGLALWAISARDAYVVAGGDREAAWLQPRTLTIAAVVILLLTAAALLRAIPTRGAG